MLQKDATVPQSSSAPSAPAGFVATASAVIEVDRREGTPCAEDAASRAQAADAKQNKNGQSDKNANRHRKPSLFAAKERFCAKCGKHVKSVDYREVYCNYSLNFVSSHNRFRVICTDICHHPCFDQVILLLIIFSSVLLALEDSTVIKREDGTVGQLSSARNDLLRQCEYPLLGIFATEAMCKIIAMGFVAKRNCYLRDPWNVLDFVVVLAGAFPQVKALRTVRVLRPLRTLSRFPGMRALVAALLNSLRPLANVAILMLFFFFIFAILSVQLWGWNGALLGRCRLTKHPVQLFSNGSWSALHQCTADGKPVEADSGSWTMDTSPWRTPRPCVWPLATKERFSQNLCRLPGNFGFHSCPQNQVCGSDYDRFGHPRFADHGIMAKTVAGTWLGYGYRTFRSVPSSALIIMQTITLSDWRFAMYSVQDAYSPVMGGIFFVLLVIFGGFFLINLALAAIWDTFAANERSYHEQRQIERGVAKWKKLDHKNVADRKGFIYFADMLKTDACRRATLKQLRDLAKEYKMACAATGEIGSHEYLQLQRLAMTFHVDEWYCKAKSVSVQRRSNGVEQESVSAAKVYKTSWLSRQYAALCAAARKLVVDRAFERAILMCIIVNTLTLSMDRFSDDPTTATDIAEMLWHVEKLNLALTLVFALEMVLKMIGLGIREYMSDEFNAFDSFIVVVSLIELALLPPLFLYGSAMPSPLNENGNPTVHSSGGALSALRAFRLFRVLKLATRFPALQQLLRTIVRIAKAVANFVVLLFLSLYIFSLFGMQLFANKFHFDSNGVHVALTDPNWTECPYEWANQANCSVVPRNNFDTFLGAFEATFETIVEGWSTNVVDARRIGMTANSMFSSNATIMFFVVLVAVGHVILLNLFLAILLVEFERENKISKSRALQHSGAGGNVEQEPENANTRDRIVVECDLSKTPEPIGSDSLENALVGVSGKDSKPTVAQARVTSLGIPSSSDADLAQKAAATDSKQDSNIRMSNRPRLEQISSRYRIEQNLKKTDAQDMMKTPSIDNEQSLVIARKAPPVRLSRTKTRCAWWAGAAELNLTGNSLCFFSPESSIRQLCAFAITRPSFDNVVLGLIFVSSILLAIENPLHEDNPERETLVLILRIMNLILTVLFTLEMVLKVIAKGFFFQNRAYMHSGWNVLDFFIVCVALLALAADSLPGELRSLRSLRGLRALRPLRMISRNPGMKIVVNALFKSVPNVVNVMILCMIAFLIFSIISVNYFKGAFSMCQGKDFDLLNEQQKQSIRNPVQFADILNTTTTWSSDAIFAPTRGGINGTLHIPSPKGYKGQTSRAVCEWYLPPIQAEPWRAAWRRSTPMHFDTIESALMVVYQICAREGWIEVMWAAVDSTQPQMQPQRNYNRSWVFLFIFMIAFGSISMMNLFVGVVIANFNELKNQNKGNSVLLTPAQLQWVRLQEMMLRHKPLKGVPEPTGWIHRICHKLSNRSDEGNTWNGRFETFIMLCIVLNTMFMAVRHRGQTPEFTDMIEIANYIFAGIFTMEFLIKWRGLSFRVYWRDGWNRFDFFLVLATDVSLVVRWASGTDIGSFAVLVRIFRVCRIVRLVKSAKGLRSIFNTLMLTLPAMGNITSLLFLMYFIYAVLGVQLFAKVRLNDNGAFNIHANFQDFFTAMLTLVTVSTGESWNTLMYDIAGESLHDRLSFECEREPTYAPQVCEWRTYPDSSYATDCVPINGCGSSSAYPFFITFSVLVSFVFINLFIAVIIEGTSQSSDIENGNSTAEAQAGESVGLTEEEYVAFTTEWVKHDVQVTRQVDEHGLFKLLAKLDEPLGYGLGEPDSTASMRKRVAELHIPHDMKTVVDSMQNETTLKVYQFEAVCLGLAKRVLSMLVAAEASQKGTLETGDTEEDTEHGKIVLESDGVEADRAWNAAIAAAVNEHDDMAFHAQNENNVDFAARQMQGMEAKANRKQSHGAIIGSRHAARKLVSRTVV